MVKILRSIIFLFCLVPNLAYADIWGSISECVTDPCGCGCSDVNETWNGTSKSYKHYCNCPPYNKPNGRAGCLKKFSLPGESAVNYLSFCAEDPGGNTYFNPKARVRMQACNVGACWTETMKLNYDGQCTQWASPYGIPLLRLCARIAVPASSSLSGQSDDGYTTQEHLNSEGATVTDTKVQTIIYNPDGTSTTSSVFIDRPKLCIYNDPWVLDDPLDLMDINPLYQPFHAGSGLSPIADVMIAIANMQMSYYELMPQIMAQIGMPDSITNFLMQMIDVVGQDVVIATIKTFGQLNLDVTGHLGCLEIPLGPFPPPYCSPMQPIQTSVTIDPICPTVTADTGLCASGDTCLVPPDATNKCVLPSVVGLTNNVINNMVRIGFDNFIPLCLPNTEGITPSTCVNINMTGGVLASAAHALNDILPVCGTSPCVSTTLPVSGGNNGFRILYATQNGPTVGQPNAYYTNGVPDCPTSQGLSDGSQCQSVWGINAGPFKDVTLTFPATEFTLNQTTLVSSSVSMLDLTGVSRSFEAAITRVQNPTDSNAASLNITDQDPTNICVFDISKSPAVLTECVPRATAPMPTVTTGNGDNFNPNLNVTLSVGTNSTTGSLTVPAVHSTSVTTSLNLAGFSYTSFVTDNYYNVAPFTPLATGSSGVTSPSAGYLYGTYLPNKAGITDPTKATAPDVPQYLSGLEYVNNKYRIANIINGPTPTQAQICLSGIKVSSCPENPQNCVLSYLDRNDIVSCSAFSTKAATYPGLSKCNAYKTLCSPSTPTTPDCTAAPASCPTIVNGSCPEDACTYVDNVSGFDGKGSVNIYSCSDASGTSYCYYYPTMDDICQVSTDPNKRIAPATTDIVLTSTEYYNYSISNANSSAVTASINAQKQLSPDDVSCSYYLSTNGVLPIPYSTITQCSAPCDSAKIVEYFVSPDPSQTLTICNITPDGSDTNSYCYTPTDTSSTCQVSEVLTLAYQPPVATPPNTAYSANVRASAITANQLLPSGSSVSCQSFVGGVNYNYAGINACTPDQLTSCSTLVEKFSSTSPNTSITIQQCPDLSYCYNQTVGSSCVLGCTGAKQQPIQMSCKSFLSLVTVPDYSSIRSCSDSVCPSLSELQATYSTASSCTSTTPSCTLVETVKSGSLSVQVNNCSASYTVTDAYNVALASDVATSFYCYNQADSSCTLNTTNTTRTTAANVAASNPVTSVVPLVCPVASTAPPTSATSSTCDQTNSYFNSAVCGIRNKTDVERGLCAGVPTLPNCSVINSPGVSDGNATWPVSQPGILVSGVCADGYSKFVDASGTELTPQRYCLVNPDAPNAASSVAWGALLDAKSACILTATCPKVLPTAANNYTAISGGNADGSTSAGDNATITCLSGSTSTVQCVKNADNTAAFASYSNCSALTCPAITSSSTWTVSDSNGNASWVASAPSGTSVTGTCKFGYQKNGGISPTRKCDLQYDGSGNVIGAQWNTTISSACVPKTCSAIAGDQNDQLNAIWALSTPTAYKSSSGEISKISGQGASGSGWVLGTCKQNATYNKYFCYSNDLSSNGPSSHRPALQPRRQCIIDSAGNVAWGDPYQGTGSGQRAVGCCKSCSIHDYNESSCHYDSVQRDAQGIPYGDVTK